MGVGVCVCVCCVCVACEVASGVRESLPQSESNLLDRSPERIAAREERLRQHRSGDPRQPGVDESKLRVTPQTGVKLDATNPMLALEWHGKKNVMMAQRASPLITDPRDVVVRVTSTSICGSDTHMYVNEVPGVSVMKAGDIMGHEGPTDSATRQADGAPMRGCSLRGGLLLRVCGALVGVQRWV